MNGRDPALRRRWRIALSLALLLCVPVPVSSNTLTPQEVQDGWILLFDGATLYGWVRQGNAMWNVSGGSLVGQSGSASYIRTSSAFSDFLFRCEFRLATDVDSGIYVRFEPPGEPFLKGYEVQINNNDAEFPTGSIRNQGKSAKYDALVGLWHRVEIQALGDRLTVSVDGIRTADVRDTKSKVGYIGLAAPAGGKMEFKNVKLKPLGGRSLFNGRDLSGWRVVDSPSSPDRPRWSVGDGEIHVEGAQGQLESESTYGDFILQLGVRTPPLGGGRHPAGGVFFRGAPGELWSGYESQIRNEYAGGDRRNPVDYGTGGLTNLQRARMVVSSDSDLLFFTKTIVARGPHVDIWVNGYLVTSYEDLRPPGGDARTYAQLGPGTISLQAEDSSGAQHFKNIKIVSLPATKSEGPIAASPMPLPTPLPPTPSPVPPVPQPTPSPFVDPLEVQRKAQVGKLIEQALRAADPQEQATLYEQILLIDPSNQVAYNGRRDALTEIQRRDAEKAKLEQEGAQKQQQSAAQLATRQDALRKAREAIARAEGALLSGNLAAARTSIAIARQIMPDDPNVQRLGGLIDNKFRFQQWRRLLAAGLGSALLIGGAIVLFLRRGKTYPYLDMIEGVHKGKRYSIDKEVICMGAIEQDGGDRNDIVVQDVEHAVSRFHCEIHRRGKRMYLLDCKSSNGTFLNGKRVPAGKPVRLRRGSLISLARTITFRLGFEKRKS